MEVYSYQKKALKTYDPKSKQLGIVYLLLGLAGESGEVVEKYKKLIRNTDGVMTDDFKLEMIKELGDLLWYLTIIGTLLDYDLEEIMDINISKLEDRYLRDKIKSVGDNR